MKQIKIDDKWSIEYDDDQNNLPRMWLRYGEPHFSFRESNSTLALFYALLEARGVDVQNPQQL